MLRSKFYSAEQVEAIVKDYRTAGLSEQEVALIDFAIKLTDHSYKISPRDFDRLRGMGLTDEDIVDVAATAAQRNFFSKLVDALGGEPEEAFRR
ncbi:MAG: carboxymuconolactone decarboxylase family protein [bacterium]